MVWCGQVHSGIRIFEAIEGSATFGKWNDSEKIKTAVLKLTEAAKALRSGCLELQAPDISWSEFNRHFQNRFKDGHNDQYNFIQLQTAKQKKGETPQEFADRYRALAHKTVLKVDDPTLQKFHYDQAQRMLLAAFTTRLAGMPGQLVRFRLLQTIGEALQIAVTVYEADAQENRDITFH
jgi:hypothetical protein